jgi:hypothetical protein
MAEIKGRGTFALIDVAASASAEKLQSAHLY